MIEQLRIVEIELFSFCNRKCYWCPNKDIDRTFFEYLDRTLFVNLLAELRAHDFSGVFSFSRYNEPFSDIETLFEAIRVIKTFFPYNKIVSNTNGDYITRDVLDKAPVDELTIMDYDCRGWNWVYNRLIEWNCVNIQKHKLFYTAQKNNMKILYYPNWPITSNITDRGGLLKEYATWEPRWHPCYEPQYYCGINYDGTVSPCCNVRNDAANKELILGDLREQSLEEILCSKKAQDLRIRCEKKDFPVHCMYCDNWGGRYTTKKGMLDY